MLTAQVIGVGAAGNKGAFALVRDGVIAIEDTLLVNSTIKDIPSEYEKHKNLVVEIGTKGFEGCGKERSEGERLAVEAIQNGNLNLSAWVKPSASMVIIITSTEGGTGSGASVVIAKYLRDVLHVETKIYAFTGFEEDSRGLRNTVEFFKRMQENYSMHVIRNKKFIGEAGNNFTKAEALANKELSTQISLILGHSIIDSDTNMDDTDLRKVSTNSGYTDVLYREIQDKIKNVEEFNKIVRSMIDNSRGMDVTDPSQTLMGVILNIPENERDAIDYNWTEVINRYGEPFERFRHIQYNDEIKRSITIITTGMKIPIEEIQAVYDRYKERNARVNRQREDFASAFEGLDMENDDMFSLRNKNRSSDSKPSEKDLSAFFGAFNAETPNVPKNTASNKAVKSDKDISKY